MSFILGISAYYHDSSACLIKNGEIFAAAQEERFTRIKHDPSFPSLAIKYCLEQANITSNQVSHIAFYDKPFLKFERLLETYLAYAPKGFKSFATSMPVWLKDKLFQKSLILNELKSLFGDEQDWSEKLFFSEHHLSHAASAFFPSPFDAAAVLTMDGVGEWTTTSLAIGNKNNLNVIKEIHFPHSLGLLYSAFTYYTGFKVNSGEYKLMGLAPYGNPKYIDAIKNHLIDIKEDGSFMLNMEYFDFCTGLTMTNNKFNKLFGAPPRKPESLITQREMDLAASIQKITEEVVVKLSKDIRKTTKQKNLCLAGGVALNCVANGVLHRNKIFDKIWVQPASGDAGGSIGAALSIYYIIQKNKRVIKNKLDGMNGSFLGPEFSNSDIAKRLHSCKAKFNKKTDAEIVELTAKGIADGKAIGWMNGRMEFGPRALGGRSIIADPRSSKMQKLLNLKVKYRESFRPFAPSILNEDLNSWFDHDQDSPYMLFVADILKSKQKKMKRKEKKLFGIDKLNVPRSEVPAITHVDYSARLQTVHKETNPKYYNVINYFKKLTGCPMVVNTSFNIRGEPIVCSPEDAFKCFMGTGLDCLVVGNYFLIKEDQDKNLVNQYIEDFNLD